MLLGVISDTHDRLPAIRKAVEIFNAANVEAVLHCGDFVAPFAMLPFRDLNAPFHAVFGNNDGEKEGLANLFTANGWSLNQRPHTFRLNGSTISMLHEPAPIEGIISSGGSDIVVFGHTHVPFFEMRAGTMVVNPGEGCGWVKKKPTLAILDTVQKSCHFEEILVYGDGIK